MAIQPVVNLNTFISTGQGFSPASGDNVAAIRTVANSPAPVAQPAVQSPAPAPSSEEVREAADKINKVLQSLVSSNLQFSVDQDSGQTIVRVVETETKDVIRQIPNEEALAIAKSLGKFQGLLIEQKA
jgi:flagellar protein FlaG